MTEIFSITVHYKELINTFRPELNSSNFFEGSVYDKSYVKDSVIKGDVSFLCADCSGGCVVY